MPWRAIVLLLFAAPAVAHAQFTGDATLDYVRGTGTDDCPEEQGVRDAVIARVGHDPFVDDAATVVHLRVERTGRALLATITVERGAIAPTPHVLRSTPGRCDELVDAAALAVSLALTQPAEVGRSGEPPPHVETPPAAHVEAPTAGQAEPHHDGAVAPPAEPVATPGSEPDAAHHSPTTPAAPATDRLAIELGATLLGTLGPTPQVSAGLALALGLRVGSFSANIEARGDMPTGVGTPAVTEAFFAGALVACVHVGALGLCASGTVGALRGEQRSSPPAATPYVALGARAVVDVGLAPGMALRFAVAADAAIVRTDVRVDGGLLWSTPAVAGWLGAGIVVDLR